MSALLNMASAFSWNGKIHFSSPLLTDGHLAMVLTAVVPLYLLSRTILLMSRLSVVGM